MLECVLHLHLVLKQTTVVTWPAPTCGPRRVPQLVLEKTLSRMLRPGGELVMGRREAEAGDPLGERVCVRRVPSFLLPHQVGLMCGFKGGVEGCMYVGMQAANMWGRRRRLGTGSLLAAGAFCCSLNSVWARERPIGGNGHQLGGWRAEVRPV